MRTQASRVAFSTAAFFLEWPLSIRSRRSGAFRNKCANSRSCTFLRVLHDFRQAKTFAKTDKRVGIYSTQAVEVTRDIFKLVSERPQVQEIKEDNRQGAEDTARKAWKLTTAPSCAASFVPAVTLGVALGERAATRFGLARLAGARRFKR